MKSKRRIRRLSGLQMLKSSVRDLAVKRRHLADAEIGATYARVIVRKADDEVRRLKKWVKSAMKCVESDRSYVRRERRRRRLRAERSR